MKKIGCMMFLMLVAAVTMAQNSTDDGCLLNIKDVFMNVFKSRTISTRQLKNNIQSLFNDYPEAIYAVAYKDLSTGEKICINEKECFHAASTMKTPVMTEVFKQAFEHKFSLDDSILVHNKFRSIADNSFFSVDSADDSEKGLYTLIGSKVPLSDILSRMITKSSNLSTNLIIEKIGAENVNRTMRSIGAKDIGVLRGVEDIKAYEKEMNNTVSAADLMLLFKKMAEGELVSPDASQRMIDILTNQHFKNIIGGKLPPDVQVASKSGSITGVCHDSGIVFLPDGKKYVLVLLSSGIKDEKTSSQLLSSASKLIYDYTKNIHKSDK